MTRKNNHLLHCKKCHKEFLSEMTNIPCKCGGKTYIIHDEAFVTFKDLIPKFMVDKLQQTCYNRHKKNKKGK